MEHFREHFCSLLFPLRCPVCDELLTPEETKNGIHSACESKLFPIYGAVCMHCGRPIGDRISLDTKKKLQTDTHFRMKQNDVFLCEMENTREYCRECTSKGYTKKSFVTQAKALYLYKGAIKQSMYRFKYSNKREYAKYFAKQACMHYGAWLKQVQAEAIVPVPMYAKKQKRRGYNQAESFAEALSEYTGISMDVHMVYRVKNTIPQKGLSESERKINLENAFQKGKTKASYESVLIVDDIYTTGNTAEAVARECIRQGVKKVYLMMLCIGEEI